MGQRIKDVVNDYCEKEGEKLYKSYLVGDMPSSEGDLSTHLPGSDSRKGVKLVVINFNGEYDFHNEGNCCRLL